MFKRMRVNWKTTVGAVLGIAFFGAAQAGIEIANIDSWGEVVGTIMLALGLTQARDDNKSSEANR